MNNYSTHKCQILNPQGNAKWQTATQEHYHLPHLKFVKHYSLSTLLQTSEKNVSFVIHGACDGQQILAVAFH